MSSISTSDVPAGVRFVTDSSVPAEQSGRWDGISALSLATAIYVVWNFSRVFADATPIDRALPAVAAALALVAWCVRDSRWFLGIEASIPLLLACSIALPDPRQRAIGYGVVVAGAFCGALIASVEMTAVSASGFVISAVALIRWIARERMEIGREAVIAIGCVLLALAFRQRRIGIAVAIAAALISPAIPSRTAAIPLAAAGIAWIYSFAFRRRRNGEPAEWIVVDYLAVLMIAGVLLVFPWSGIAARALPYFWRAEPAGARLPLHYALVPGQSIDIDVPEGAQNLVVSAANALAMKPGTIVGKIEPGSVVRIGEIADWGYSRREQFWKSHNVLPERPGGIIRGYGYDAWVDGAGIMSLTPKVRRIRVSASAAMPPDARLQVEFFEMGRSQ